MKRIQFSVIYVISGQDALTQYSNGVDVEVRESDTALTKHTKLLMTIKESHNINSIFTVISGVIEDFNLIGLRCVVRLD